MLGQVSMPHHLVYINIKSTWNPPDHMRSQKITKCQETDDFLTNG